MLKLRRNLTLVMHSIVARMCTFQTGSDNQYLRLSDLSNLLIRARLVINLFLVF